MREKRFKGLPLIHGRVNNERASTVVVNVQSRYDFRLSLQVTGLILFSFGSR